MRFKKTGNEYYVLSVFTLICLLLAFVLEYVLNNHLLILGTGCSLLITLLHNHQARQRNTKDTGDAQHPPA